MDELSAIVTAIEECDGESVLATVVDVDGSSYRRPGARMLILPGSDACDDAQRRIGMISGGCLERELCRAAVPLTRDGPTIVSFDTRADRLHPYGQFGSGCHGLLHLLLERVDEPYHRAAAQLRFVAGNEQPLAVGVVCRNEGPMPAVGDRFDETTIDAEIRLGKRFRRALLKRIRDSLAQCKVAGQSVMTRFVDGDAWCEIFFHRLTPAPPLWIFGAGDDAIPLAQMAEIAGMRVSVFDKRNLLLTAARFGETVARHVLHPMDVVASFSPSAATSVVLMTHSLADDGTLLPWALDSPASYVGLLGPKRRTGQILWTLAERGITIAPSKCEKLRTPTGLDLGASNAAEIAVAIVAEIIATRNGREGRPLLHRTEPIHPGARHEVVELEFGESREFAAVNMGQL
jgi:xanthine dehydrogenase accessory factor